MEWLRISPTLVSRTVFHPLREKLSPRFLRLRQGEHPDVMRHPKCLFLYKANLYQIGLLVFG